MALNMHFIYFYVMFFRKEITVRRETSWRGIENLLPLELLNMLLGEQLPEHKGRQAQQQEHPWHSGDC